MTLAVHLADARLRLGLRHRRLDADRRRPRRVLRAAGAAHPARGADAPAGARPVTTTAPRAGRPVGRRPRHVPPARSEADARTSSPPAGALLAVVAVIVLTVVLSENVVYFRTVSEAVKDRKSQGTSRFRLAGAVVPGSIDDHGARRRVQADRRQAHRHRRAPRRPAGLFKNGAPVVCEGRWAAASGRGARSTATGS